MRERVFFILCWRKPRNLFRGWWSQFLRKCNAECLYLSLIVKYPDSIFRLLSLRPYYRAIMHWTPFLAKRIGQQFCPGAYGTFVHALTSTKSVTDRWGEPARFSCTARLIPLFQLIEGRRMEIRPERFQGGLWLVVLQGLLFILMSK